MAESYKLSSSLQDYLEAILELSSDNRPVRVTDIANRLGIAKASVNQTLGKLKESGLIRQQAYGPVELTLQGAELAEKISGRHSKLRKFLTEILGVDHETAERDACLMEHAVSPLTMEKLTAFLLKNGYVMNGVNKEIPKGAENMKAFDKEPEGILPLSELKEGQKGTIVKVKTKGIIRRRIMEMGIISGTEVVVKGFAPLGDPMELGIKGYNLSLRKAEASGILVELHSS